MDPELLTNVLRRTSYGTLEELYAAIGYGGFTAQKAVSRIQGELGRIAANTPSVLDSLKRLRREK